MTMQQALDEGLPERARASGDKNVCTVKMSLLVRGHAAFCLTQFPGGVLIGNSQATAVRVTLGHTDCSKLRSRTMRSARRARDEHRLRGGDQVRVDQHTHLAA